MGGAFSHSEMLDAIQIVESQRNHDLSQTIANMFITSAPVLMQVMRHALEQGNLRELVRAAEALRSSSASLGAFRLANLCRALGQMPSKADLANVSSQLDAIERATAIVCAALMEKEFLSIDQ